MADVCDRLRAANAFLCHYSWPSGAGGKRSLGVRTDGELLARVSAVAGEPFVQAKDDYLVNSLGIYNGRIYASTKDPSYTFAGKGRALLSFGDDTVQVDAPQVLTFMNSGFDQGNYVYSESGRNVTVYVVDQRVTLGHPELGQRLSTDRFQSFSSNITAAAICSEEHGTHIASLVGGDTFGVAKDVTVVSVAVTAGCGADSRASELLAGLDYVHRHIRSRGPSHRSVVAISASVRASPVADMIEAAVQVLLDDGAVVVTGAGDSSDDACEFVPARMPGVITAAAANMTARTAGHPWEGSNYGRCVSVWGPGSKVVGASAQQGVKAVFSGTTQATALVTGVVAQTLQDLDHTNARERLIKQSSNVVMDWTTPDTAPFFAQVKPPTYGGTCACKLAEA